MAAPTALLARIHEAGRRRWERAPDESWNGGPWGLADLARRVERGPDRVLVVDSHRDLDRKNTLHDDGGTLLALDWDAAGPTAAVAEAAGVALDWSGDDPRAFGAAMKTYAEHSGVTVDPQPWIFGGWVAAQGGWLDYNATHRGDPAEVAGTLARLRALAANLDTLLAAV